MQSFPSHGRLLLLVVLLPAFVAGSNQLLFELTPSFHGLNFAIYPWMAISIAVLSWSAGRYLSPAWLRWVVFAWCLILLDLLTIAACLTYRVEMHFGHMMVAAQISLIVLWAVLASGNWQWRMPLGLVAVAVLIVFSSTFRSYWGAPDWNLLMIVTSLVILLVCGAIRLSGFALQQPADDTLGRSEHQSIKTTQFGLKHMLIWATALVPILRVMRGLDFFVLKRLGAPDIFSFALVAMVMAAVNLIAIWSVLGQGHWMLRLAALLAVPYLLAVGTSMYVQYIESTYRTTWAFGRWDFSRAWYDSLVRTIADQRESLVNWLCLNAALLAALLLFLRASGYRLMGKCN
jgi:hypothetical protein